MTEDARHSAGSPDAPLHLPLRGASFAQAFSRFWRKYTTFSGRASRSEFWWWYLANVIVTTVLGLATGAGGFAGATYDAATRTSQPGPLIGVGAILLTIWGIATLVPWLALSWRRLHDVNLPGALWFVGLVPVLGGLALIVLFVLASNPAGARYDA